MFEVVKRVRRISVAERAISGLGDCDRVPRVLKSRVDSIAVLDAIVCDSGEWIVFNSTVLMSAFDMDFVAMNRKTPVVVS